MTVVSVEYSDIIDLLGKQFPMEEIRSRISMIGAADEGVEGETLSFDISPNRPDMYSVEGIVRALRGVMGLEAGLPRFEVGESTLRFVIQPSVESVRPFAVGGLVRNVEMTDELVRSLMDLQEKLHTTMGRRRKRVAIGIHDFDKVKGPLTYRAVDPESVEFKPLGMAESLTLADILKKHEKGREYAHILEGKSVYPIIEDAESTVLSFPPVINGIATALTEDTRNLFVDVTGTDPNAANSTLNIICTSLYERGGRLESIILGTPSQEFRIPNLEPRLKTMRNENANKLLGLDLSPQESAEYLERMRFGAKVLGEQIEVRIPAYRVDILHEVDLIEDIAVGYGYQRVPLRLPRAAAIGSSATMTTFSETLKELMVGYGYQEIMSLSMADPAMPFKGGTQGPRIRNPVSIELGGLRSSLLPSLLKILSMNTHRDLPQRVFEVEDVLSNGKNERRLAGASIHAKASFTEVKSLVQSVFRDLGHDFHLEAAVNENFIPGRCASAVLGGKPVCVFGEIAPEVLDAYGLTHPVVVFELNAMVLEGKH